VKLKLDENLGERGRRALTVEKPGRQKKGWQKKTGSGWEMLMRWQNAAQAFLFFCQRYFCRHS
jgi:hypothetical protein